MVSECDDKEVEKKKFSEKFKKQGANCVNISFFFSLGFWIQRLVRFFDWNKIPAF